MSQLDALEKGVLPSKTASLHMATPEIPTLQDKADVTLQMIEEGLVLADISPQQNLHLLRRIDFYIMPLIYM